MSTCPLLQLLLSVAHFPLSVIECLITVSVIVGGLTAGG